MWGALLNNESAGVTAGVVLFFQVSHKEQSPPMFYALYFVTSLCLPPKPELLMLL